MTDEKEIEKIEEYLPIHIVADCWKCPAKEEVVGLDSYGASKHFYDHGWRVVRGKLLCPNCSKTKDKSK